jgi:hypothetical protein
MFEDEDDWGRREGKRDNACGRAKVYAGYFTSTAGEIRQDAGFDRLEACSTRT